MALRQHSVIGKLLAVTEWDWIRATHYVHIHLLGDKMLTTHIRHGDLVIDMEADGTVQLVRQSNGQCIRLSLSEWEYVQRVAALHSWPVAPPQELAVQTTQ